MIMKASPLPLLSAVQSLSVIRSEATRRPKPPTQMRIPCRGCEAGGSKSLRETHKDLRPVILLAEVNVQKEHAYRDCPSSRG
jgi:hypothetical protein